MVPDYGGFHMEPAHLTLVLRMSRQIIEDNTIYPQGPRSLDCVDAVLLHENIGLLRRLVLSGYRQAG